MMSRVTRVDPLKRIEGTCSFCGKDHMQVPEIVAGPTVFICSGCIDLCNDVLRDRYALLHEAIRHALQQMRAACEVQEKIAFDQAVSTLRAHLNRIRNRFDAQELRWERMLFTCLQDAVAYTPMSRINPDMVNRLLELFLGVITITRSNPQRSDVSELSFRLQAAGFDLFPTS